MTTANTHTQPTAYFWHGDALRSRSVSTRVHWGQLTVPALPSRLLADCEREVALTLALAPGDVEPLSLPRARSRWPQYRQCVQAAADWLGALGLPPLLASSEVALMACRGTRYHHDGDQYGGKAFCNLFLSEDSGAALHFPATGHRISLSRGTVVLFDTAQCHAVTGPEATQLFLTWELPMAHAQVAPALQIELDTDPLTASQLQEEQVWIRGARVQVCPDSGQWLRQASSL